MTNCNLNPNMIRKAHEHFLEYMSRKAEGKIDEGIQIAKFV